MGERAPQRAFPTAIARRAIAAGAPAGQAVPAAPRRDLADFDLSLRWVLGQVLTQRRDLKTERGRVAQQEIFYKVLAAAMVMAEGLAIGGDERQASTTRAERLRDPGARP